MMQGTVTADKEAILTLIVRNGSRELAVEAIVDTGFTDYLTLTADHINTLDLPLVGTSLVTLADGSEVQLGIYRAVVLWHGEERAIQTLAAEGGPLLGMSLLYGSRLVMDVLDGSAFTITALV